MSNSPPIAVSKAAGDSRRRAPRWMWALLIVSLSLNLVVAGIVIAAGILRPFAGGGANLMGLGLVRYSLSRSSDTRSETRRLIQSERPRIEPLRRELATARRAVADAFVADPFDAARLKAAQARVIEAERKLGEETIDALVTIAGKLSPADRRDYVAERMHRMRHWGRGDPAEERRP